jgi:NitT/TauT family transport system substrate-binding protein
MTGNRWLAAILALALAGAAGPVHALDQVRFGTNWLAQAEHGGFYQAVADGTYEKYGLAVTIVQGGPQAANRALLLAGKVDFYMAGNMIQPLLAIPEGIPIVEVAAIFQKDPAAFLVHPEAPVETFADIAKLPTLFISKDSFATWYRWVMAAYPAFTEEQVKPYTFNAAPFLADRLSAQQGYVTSEPHAIEREGGFTPKVFLIADAGFETYSTLIETTHEMVETRPELVQRFVDASIIGWRTYLHGDNSLGNALIREQNPEMTEAQIAASVAAMARYGIVESGDAAAHGIGCMTDARQQAFYAAMTAAGVVPAGLDIARAYTTRFVCKGVGAGTP